MKTNFFLLLLLAFLFSCQSKKTTVQTFEGINTQAVELSAQDMPVAKESPIEISMDMAAENKILPLSTWADSISYIRLETTSDALIGSVDRLILRDSVIYILDRKKSRSIYAFATDGTFLRKIGDIGQGPGEFAEPTDFSVCQDKIYVYDQFAHRLSTFTTAGKFLGDRPVPFFGIGMHAFNDSTFAWHTLDADNFHLKNLVGYSVLLSDSTDHVTKRGFYRKPKKYASIWVSENFQGNDSIILYHPPLSGNLYAISPTGTITPKYHIDFKEHTLPESYLWEENWKQFTDENTQRKYLLFPGEFYENDIALYFVYLKKHVHHYAIYEKQCHKLWLTENIKNDLFPALPFGQMKAAHGNKFITMVSPADLLYAYKQLSPDQRQEILGTDGIRLLSELEEEDNPILIISHWRK